LHLRWLPPCPFSSCARSVLHRALHPAPDLHPSADHEDDMADAGSAPAARLCSTGGKKGRARRKMVGAGWKDGARGGKDCGGGARLEHRIYEMKLSSLNVRVVRFPMI
jgi:hypothetical protein